MTITRLGQLSAELRTTADVALFAGGALAPSISATKARTGGYSYRGNVTPFGLACATAQVRGHFFLNHNGGSNSPALVTFAVGAASLRFLWDVTAAQFQLIAGYQYNSSSLYVPVTASAGGFGTPDQWKAIGFTYRCAESGGFCSLYIDGVQVLNWTGDTRIYRQLAAAKEPASISGVYAVGYSGSSTWGSYAYVDDLYVDDASGEPDAPPPGRRFLFSLADATGASSGWTPLSGTNVSNVDENPNDGDTSYVKALSAGLSDLYNTADITLPADHAIAAVIPVAVARKTEAGVDTRLRLLAYDGANTTVGSDQQLSTDYGVIWERMAAQPDGSSWGSTADDFNATQFGVRSAGSF